ncbi:MAG: NrfD/PsrC family molybdoenzyme membrane anchor subunit [Candidatus Methylomirabilales bacterium]
MTEKKVSLQLWMILALILALGIPGVYDRLVYGHLHANYGQFITWGLWVAAYVFFIGASAGAFLLSTLAYVFGIKKYEPLGRLSLFTALIALLASLILILCDLGHPFRALVRVIISPNFSSIMAWIVWLYLVYTIILVGELWLLMRVDLVRAKSRGGISGSFAKILAFGSSETSPESVSRDRRMVRILGMIGIFVAIFFHGGVGALFAVVGARPFWHTGLLPITFLVSALLSGGALVVCLAPLFGRGGESFREMVGSLAKLVGWILAFEILILFSEILVTLKGGIPSHAAALRLMMTGPFAWVFWVLQVAGGMVIPLFLLFGRPRLTLKASALASFLILIGIFGFRLNIVIPQLAVPAFAGLPETYHSLRMMTSYVPSLAEWALLFFVVGFAGLIFLWGYKSLPLVASPAEQRGV